LRCFRYDEESLLCKQLHSGGIPALRAETPMGWSNTLYWQKPTKPFALLERESGVKKGPQPRQGRTG
jgi:hypothetical protein